MPLYDSHYSDKHAQPLPLLGELMFGTTPVAITRPGFKLHQIQSARAALLTFTFSATNPHVPPSRAHRPLSCSVGLVLLAQGADGTGEPSGSAATFSTLMRFLSSHCMLIERHMSALVAAIAGTVGAMDNVPPRLALQNDHTIVSHMRVAAQHVQSLFTLPRFPKPLWLLGIHTHATEFMSALDVLAAHNPPTGSQYVSLKVGAGEFGLRIWLADWRRQQPLGFWRAASRRCWCTIARGWPSCRRSRRMTHWTAMCGRCTVPVRAHRPCG